MLGQINQSCLENCMITCGLGKKSCLGCSNLSDPKACTPPSAMLWTAKVQILPEEESWAVTRHFLCMILLEQRGKYFSRKTVSGVTYTSNTSSKYQMTKSSREHRKYFAFFDYASHVGQSVLESDHFSVSIWRSIKLTIIQENHLSLRLGHFVLCWGHAPHSRTLLETT